MTEGTRFAPWRLLARGWPVLVAASVGVAMAQPAAGTTYPPAAYSGCNGCHQTPTLLPGASPGANDPHRILLPALTDASSLKSLMVGPMAGFASMSDTTADTLIKYLNDVKAGVLLQASTLVTTGSVVSLTGTISGGASTSAALTFDNYRGADMPFTFVASGTGTQRPGDFTVTNTCPASPVARTNVAAPVAASAGVLTPQTCALNIAFHPSDDTTDATRTATVTLDVTAADGLDPDPVVFTISGTAAAPLVIASTPAAYVTPKSVSKDETLEIVDSLGNAFRLCPDTSPAPFRIPGDYSLPTLPLDGDGCGRVPAVGSGTLPRTLDIPIRFTPGADGPSNATYDIRRLDAGGTPTGRTYTVDLLGNQGAFVSIAPAPLFAGVSVEETNHATADAVLTVSSKGTAPVTFTGTSLGGNHPGDYTVVAGGCTLLPGLPKYTDGGPDQQCSYTLRFDPSDVGSRDATFVVTTSAGATTIALGGTGKRAPRLVVTEGGAPVAANATLDFGHQTVGGLYPSRLLTLANVGTTGALQVALAGSSPSGFVVGADPGCASLAPATSCNLTVAFAPAALQPYAGTLSIQSLAAGASSPASFALALAGIGDATAIPVLAWQNETHQPISSVEFGDVVAGASGTTTVKVHNFGQGGVQVHLVNVTGLDATQFGLTASPNCQPEQDLYEREDCVLTVTFTPSGAGAKSAVLQLASGGSTLAPIPVHGSGVAGSGSVLTVSAASLSFAPTEIGTQSQPLRVVLANGGASGITVQGLDITGDFAIASGTCGAPPIALPAGGQCDVTLVFRPGTEGPASGRMRIQSDASTTPGDVALAGNGTSAPDLSSGGCSLARHGGRIDPTLWALMLGALGVLAWRLRARRRRQGTSR